MTEGQNNKPADMMTVNLGKVNDQFEKRGKNLRMIESNNTNYNQPITVQQITINCPNVTDKSGAEYIEKYLYNELGNLSLRAQQITIKH